MRRAAQVAGGLVAIVALAFGVLSMRDATMSRHQRQSSDSQLEVVLEAELRGGETGQTVAEYAWAKVLVCRTEVVRADPVSELEPLPSEDEHRFRVVLQPSLDDTDRKQFRGCMEDWTIDHLEIDVVSMTERTQPADG